MTDYIITYATQAQFYAGIESLVRRGLGFNANLSDLSIHLTGAY